MAQSNRSKKGSRLGTQLRGRLSEAYAARGSLSSKLAYAYSPRMRQDVIVKSELEFWNFILLESDAQVASVDYTPQKQVVKVGDDFLGTVLDAIVTYKDGAVEWREVKYSDDSQTRTRHQQDAQAQACYVVAWLT